MYHYRGNQDQLLPEDQSPHFLSPPEMARSTPKVVFMLYCQEDHRVMTMLMNDSSKDHTLNIVNSQILKDYGLNLIQLYVCRRIFECFIKSLCKMLLFILHGLSHVST